MNVLSLTVSAFSALAVGLVSFFWQDLLFSRLKRYFITERLACDSILEKTHSTLPDFIRPCIYLCGPIFAVLFAVLLIPTATGKIAIFFLSAFVLRRLGRRVSQHLHKRYIQKVKVRLIDTIGLIANALRSGLSLMQAFEMAADEMPGAVAVELKLIVSEIKFGATFENTLRAFKERIPLPEVKTLVDSIIILRETGGNLVETFEILTNTLREEERVRSKIKTLTTQGVFQAIVIILLPFGLGAALNILAPGYLDPLFDHPLGWAILALMIGLQILGAYLMKRIVTIKV